MSKFLKWEDFVEIKNKPSETTPPQGKGAAPYCAAHARNDGQVHIRIADKKCDKDCLVDKTDSKMKDTEKNMPFGEVPSNKKVVFEQAKAKTLSKKNKKKALGDEATPSNKDPESNLPNGVKPTDSNITTESFLKATQGLSNSEFISMMLSEEFDDEMTAADIGDEFQGDFASGCNACGKGHGHHDDEEIEDQDDNIPAVYCGRTGKRVYPTAFETARYLAYLLPENKRAVRLFVREMKSVPGALKSLMEELVTHGELYNELVGQIGSGKTKVASKFVRSMQDDHEKFLKEVGLMLNSPMGEAVSAPMDQRMGDTQNRNSKPIDNNQPEGDKEAQALVQDMPGDGTDSVDQISDAKPESPAAKLNKEFAYHHMIKEMSGYDNMVNAMNEILKR